MGIRHAVSNLSAPSVIAGLVLGLACAGGGAIAAGQITGGQIKDKTITQQDVASNTLKSRNLKNNSVKGKDIKDGSLTNQDIDVYYAVLTDEGVVVRNSGGITGLRLPGESARPLPVDFNVTSPPAPTWRVDGSVVRGRSKVRREVGLLINSQRHRPGQHDQQQLALATNRAFHLAVIC